VTGNDAGRHEPGSNDEADRKEREDAEWRSIVDNYGDPPEFATPPADPPAPEPEDPWPSLRSGALHEEPAELAPLSWELTPEDDRYVPPPAPPVPRPHGLRLLAWLGLFGVPTAVLLLIVLKVSLPSPLGFLALVWFVGGFGYLVATMNGPKDPDGGWDNGAVV
jgi:hypothetical protein